MCYENIITSALDKNQEEYRVTLLFLLLIGEPHIIDDED